MTEPKGIINGSQSVGPLTMDHILKAVDRLTSTSPIFTSMSLSKDDYEKLISQATIENKVSGNGLVGGISVSVDPAIPRGMMAAIDTENNMWIVNLETNKMWSLGKPNGWPHHMW